MTPNARSNAMTAIKHCCGNCRHYSPPKPNNRLGICTCVGAFAGTLRPPAEGFHCSEFAPTEARRLAGSECAS
jgi:hypothetical protein